MPHSYRQRLRDVLRFAVTPPAASSSSLSPPVPGDVLADLIPDLLVYIEAPALSVSQLPNNATVTFTLIECADPGLSSVISSTVLGVQTGAGGAGAGAAVFASRPKYAGGKYLGMSIAASSGVNVSGANYALAFALI